MDAIDAIIVQVCYDYKFDRIHVICSCNLIVSQRVIDFVLILTFNASIFMLHT